MHSFKANAICRVYQLEAHEKRVKLKEFLGTFYFQRLSVFIFEAFAFSDVLQAQALMSPYLRAQS